MVPDARQGDLAFVTAVVVRVGAVLARGRSRAPLAVSRGHLAVGLRLAAAYAVVLMAPAS
jgi:hypothetical protein